MKHTAMGPHPRAPNFGSMTDRDLAQVCLLIAQGQPEDLDAFAQAEAARLFLLWEEILDAPSRGVDELQRRAGLVAGLRKRTIRFMLGLRRKGELVIHEC